MRFSYFKIFLFLAVALSAGFLYIIFLYQPPVGPVPPLAPPIIKTAKVEPVPTKVILEQQQKEMLAHIQKREEEKWRQVFGQNIASTTLAQKKAQALKADKQKILKLMAEKSNLAQ